MFLLGLKKTGINLIPRQATLTVIVEGGDL